jgi:tetratricopeptide (TPR) repeat protein
LEQAGLSSDLDPQTEQLFRDRVAIVEPIATFALTNSLAGFLAPWLFVAMGIAVIVGRDRSPTWPRAAAGVALAVLIMAGCFFLTKSRTAWLAVAGGMALLAWREWRGSRGFGWRIPALAGAAMIAVVVGVFLAGGLDREVISESPKSLRYRLEYWQATAAMIHDHPWWGVGVGNFQDHYTVYKLPQASETIADPHNFLLEIWATAGLPAFLALLAVFVCLAWRAFRRDGHASQVSLGANGVFAVYAGALAGLVLALPLGLAVGFPLDVSLVVVGVPLGAACVFLLHDWTRGGRLPAYLPILAIVVLLTNFLAAGGIGFVSIATSLWLLAAMVSVMAPLSHPTFILDRKWSAGVVGLALTLGAVFYLTAYRPTLTATTLLKRGEAELERGRIEAAAQEFLAAAAADPYGDEAWRNLALLYGGHWIQTGSPQSLKAFEHAASQAVQRNPGSYALRKMIGDLYLEGYRRSPQPEYLRASLNAYRKAVGRYPNNARLRVGLAWRLHLEGDRQGAAEEATAALDLDRQNPHGEQKLAQTPAPPGAETDNLEHLAEKLRKLEASADSSPPS